MTLAFTRFRGNLGFLCVGVLVASVIMTAAPASAAVPVCTSVSISPSDSRTIGTELTASATCSNSPTNVSYQWQVSASGTTSGFVDIVGATDQTFIVTQEYFGVTAGQYFRVGVRGTNESGTGNFTYSTSLSRNVTFPVKVVAGSQAVSGFADGAPADARFGSLMGLTTDGTHLYVSDRSNNRIRTITTGGQVSTLAGAGTSGASNGAFNVSNFKDLGQITYSSSRNQIYVKDAMTIRILDLATNQVSHMLHQESPASWYQSGTTVTLTFSSDHWFYANNSVTISGISAAVDGQRTISSRTATTISFSISTSANVSSTSLSGSGATVTGIMGDISRTDLSLWYSYYNAFQVGPDGHIYMARANSGESASISKMLRFRHVSGNTYSAELVSAFNFLVCSISFESASVMYVNTCGSTLKLSTSDNWSTLTSTSLSISNNTAVWKTAGKYLFSGKTRADVTTNPTTNRTVFGSDSPFAAVDLGDHLYWVSQSFYTNALYVFENAVSGITATSDSISPSLSGSSPSDGDSNVGVSSNVVLNFSETILAGSGSVSIYSSANPSTPVESVSAASGNVSIQGSTATINWISDLLPNTEYFVQISSTAFVDAAGNAYAGINNSTSLNFSTIGLPVISSSTPADNSTNVPNNSNIVLNFGRAVSVAPSKAVTLLNTASNTTVVIPVDGAQVTGSGTTQITINPSNDLEIGTNYALLVEAGAFVDSEGLGNAAITDSATLNFSTAKIPYLGLSAALDASITSSYSGTGSTWTDLSGFGNNLTLYNSPTFVNNGTDPKSFSFNGTSQYGDFGAAKTGLLDESKYTKLVWFKPQGFSDRNNLFSSSGPNGTSNNAHAFWGGGNNAACTAGSGDNLASGHNGLWYTVVSSECLETQWQLGVVTFTSNANDANAGWRLYRNGILVGTNSDLTPIGNTTYETRIGSYSGANFFNGQISQVYLYDRALTASEINAIYEATSSYFGLNLNTVTFNANGGNVDLASLRTNAGDGSVTLRTPTKANASFLGWYTDPTSGTRVGGAGDSYNPQGSDITLYARWDNSYTVTYSAGTNATGAPASVNYLDSTGAITLPTPTRADYVFEGWYTAASGGTKVGNAGATYTPSQDVTLHGRWTQASLAGIAAADLSEVNSTTIQSGVASSNTHTIGSSSVAINIPANAFSAGVVVRVYSVANHNRAAALLPNESDFVNSMVVAWTATDTTVPVAASALTMVITDANIRAGAKIYSIVGNQSTLLATATQDGTVTISFTTDPLITIANPVVQNNGGGGGGSSGGGGGSSGGGSPIQAIPAITPKLSADQKPHITAGIGGTVELTGSGLKLITKVLIGSLETNFEVISDEKISITIPASLTESTYLKLMFGAGELEQLLLVNKFNQTKVNAGTFRGVVALYARGLSGKRFSAKVGKDWVVIDALSSDFVRIVERVGPGREIRVQIFVDRKPARVVKLLTR